MEDIKEIIKWYGKIEMENGEVMKMGETDVEGKQEITWDYGEASERRGRDQIRVRVRAERFNSIKRLESVRTKVGNF